MACCLLPYMEKAIKMIDKGGFIICPICKSKTRQKATKETYLKNFPLFCPKCKCQSIIDLIEGEVTVKETAYRQIKDRKA